MRLENRFRTEYWDEQERHILWNDPHVMQREGRSPKTCCGTAHRGKKAEDKVVGIW